MATKKKELAVVPDQMRERSRISTQVVVPEQMCDRSRISTQVVVDAQNGDRSPLSESVQMTPAELALAEHLNIDLTAPLDDLLDVAISKTNQAVRLVVESGLCYLKIKAECRHGEFIRRLDESGVDYRRAHESMVLARALAAMPEAHAELMMSLHKTKALLISSTDPSIAELMLEDGEIDINLISVPKLRQYIRELEAELTDTSVQLETTQIKADELKQALERGPRLRDDGLPVAIADARQEVLAHCDIARIALDNLDGVAAQLDELPDMKDPRNALLLKGTKRLALAGLCALAAQVSTLIENVVEQLGNDADEGRDAMRLTDQERHELAQQYHQEVAIQGNDKVQRAKTREAKRQTGRGRPIKVEPTVRGKR